MMQNTEILMLIQAETVVVILAGILGLMVDSSSFITFGKDMDRVWKVALDPYKFPPLTQMYLKYFISMLIILRTFSVHVTISLYVVMLWPAIFAERDYLLIPWISVGTLRLFINFLSTFTGLFICSKYGILSTLWIEFLLVQLLQQGPFFYAWLTIVKYYLYLNKVISARRKLMEQEIYQIKMSKKCRRKLSDTKRRMVDDQSYMINHQTITKIIDRISTRKKENMSTRSLDTLLEIIEKEHPKDDKNSINSKTSSCQSAADIQMMQKLQITNKYVELANRQLGSVDPNSGNEESISLTYDLGSNEIEQKNITMSHQSEIEDLQ